jgi:hypothetical protein
VRGGPGCAKCGDATRQKFSSVKFSEQWIAFNSVFSTVCP